jgi:hypothetical protein
MKGEGGETERNPDMECYMQSVHNGELTEEMLPPIFKRRHVKEDVMEPQRLSALWRGEIEDEYSNKKYRNILTI